jgi:hypothetical protein
MHDWQDLCSGNINKYLIKSSLTNNVIAVVVTVGVGGVVVGGVIVSGGGALVTAVDVSTGATVAADDDDAVGAVIPLSLTNDEDAYVSALVAFVGLSEIASCAACASSW